MPRTSRISANDKIESKQSARNIILYLPIKERAEDREISIQGSGGYQFKTDEDYQEVDEKKNVSLDAYMTKTGDTQIVKVPKNVMIRYENDNLARKWPTTTNVRCFWCHHNFSNVPCFTPIDVEEEEDTILVASCHQYEPKRVIFTVGWRSFCSFNCMLKHNQQDPACANFTDRSSLIYMMARYIFKRNMEDITYAFPLETMKEYGGYQTIEAYRNQFTFIAKGYEFNCPPIISVIPQMIETIALPKILANDRKAGNKYALARKKPLVV
jgi:hypothetical protein